MDSIIQDIFDRYQVRKTKKQKTAFIDFALRTAEAEGYTARVEKGMFGMRNIVVGDPDSAKILYTAHYDTCARLPFPNFLTPKNIWIYIAYNLAIILGFLMVAFVLGFVFGMLGTALGFGTEAASIAAEVAYLGLLALILFGPANKHTANDNTSGVTVLFGIMQALPETERDKVAFVFFDGEELGLFGSSAFAGKHKQAKKHTLCLNFDCVSDGETILLLTNKAAKPCRGLLEAAFVGNDSIQVDVTNKAFYPSDQANFKKGVGVAALKRTKGGMLYMNRIHTNRDTVYRRENIDFLVAGAVALSGMLE